LAKNVQFAADSQSSHTQTEREREEMRKSSFSNPISGHWEVPFLEKKNIISKLHWRADSGGGDYP
jgi:hypothetical protein